MLFYIDSIDYTLCCNTSWKKIELLNLVWSHPRQNYAQKNTHKLESLFFPVLTVEKRESGNSCQVNERINMLYRLIGETKSQKFMYLFLHQTYKNLCRHSQNQ